MTNRTVTPSKDASPRDRGARGSELGFILAAVGSAVGLGDTWRFSASEASSGGAASVVLYIGLTFAVGIPLLMAELALGRRMKLSPVGALRGAAGRAWVPAGWLFVVSGFVIFPIVFALGFNEQVVGLSASEAENVLFIALPGAFAEMATWGRVIGIVFFGALSVATLTSTISLLEVVVASVIDEFSIPRTKAAILVGAGIAALGLAPAFSLSVLGTMNSLVGEVFLAVGVFHTVIIVGWFMDDPVAELARGRRPRSAGRCPSGTSPSAGCCP